MTCSSSGAAVTVPLLSVVARHGESSGDSCLSSTPDTSHLRCAARCMTPMSTRLCSMVEKDMGTERLWPATAPLQDRATIRWICGGTKDRDKAPSTSLCQKLRIKDIMEVLHSWRLSWYVHVQCATSCISNLQRTYQFPARKAKKDLVQNVWVAIRVDVRCSLVLPAPPNWTRTAP